MARFPAGRRSRWRHSRSDRLSPPLSAAFEPHRHDSGADRARADEPTDERPAARSGEAGVPASSRPPKTPPTLGSASRVKLLRSDTELDEARARAAEQLRRITEAMGPVVRRAQSQSQKEASRSSAGPPPSTADVDETGRPGENDEPDSSRSDRASSGGRGSAQGH